jgi:hypothetical protein
MRVMGPRMQRMFPRVQRIMQEAQGENAAPPASPRP